MYANPYERQRLELTWDHAQLAPLAELNLDVIAAIAGAPGSVLQVREGGAGRAVRAGAPGGGRGSGHGGGPGGGHAGAERAAALGWGWAALGEPARARLAACPYLLLDAGFGEPARWLAIGGGNSGSAGASAGTAAAPPAAGSARSIFDANLIRRSLQYAWHLARTTPAAARIALGAGGEALAAFTACRLSQLDEVAEARPAWIRPRWPDRPQWWRSLLASAAHESPVALERLQHWGLMALAGAVWIPGGPASKIPQTPAGRSAAAAIQSPREHQP